MLGFRSWAGLQVLRVKSALAMATATKLLRVRSHQPDAVTSPLVFDGGRVRCLKASETPSKSAGFFMGYPPHQKPGKSGGMR